MNRPAAIPAVKSSFKAKSYPWGGGSYHWRRLSTPYGDFPITPDTVGPWGQAHGALGINNNAIWDPQHNRMTGGIELHSGMDDELLTEGCIAIAGSKVGSLE